MISLVILLDLYRSIWRQTLEKFAKIGMTCDKFESQMKTLCFQGPHRLLTNKILKKYIYFHKAELITLLKDVSIKIMYTYETGRHSPPDRNMTPVLYINFKGLTPQMPHIKFQSNLPSGSGEDYSFPVNYR